MKKLIETIIGSNTRNKNEEAKADDGVVQTTEANKIKVYRPRLGCR
jgi:hypothetical protein